MKKKLSFILLCIIIVFNACSNEQSLDSPPQLEIVEYGELEFTYEGNNYKSNYTVTSDSALVFVDEAVGKLFFELQDNPVLATVIDEDGSIYYYNNENIVKSTYKAIDDFEFDATNNLKSGYSNYFTVYEHQDYGGLSIDHTIGAEGLQFTYPPGTGGKNLNDKISSFKASYGGTFNFSSGYFCVTVYEDDTFRGKSYTFRSKLNLYGTGKYGQSPPYTGGASINEPNLNNYIRTEGGLFHKKRTWTDCISSFKVYCTSL